MNLSRRDFLKLMAATGVAAAVPLPSARADPLAGSGPIDLLDEPVSEETPFAWLELNGRRYGAADLSIVYTPRDVTMFGDKWRTYAQGRASTLSATLYKQPDPALLFSLASVPIRCTMPGYGRVFSTTGAVTRMASVSYGFGIVHDIEVAITGQLVRA